ncbi:MAG TPA: DUF1476 domain-containing protein [Alphaproteobacteria bacterium]|nr:DUF1476 domain-containing protein [Alphaproteobacteria bacterium]
MSLFEDREHAFERKFANEQETRFRVHAVRNRLLGQWAAQKLHLKPAEAETYAMELAQADVASFHDDEIIKKILADFLARGEVASEAEIREQLAKLLPVAKARVAGAK